MSSRRTAELPSRVTMRGLAVIGFLILATYFALKAYNGVPFKGYDKLYVEVPAVGNLREHDQVRIAGRRIGQVQKLAITRQGAARLELQIERSTPDLPVDTKVSIRAAGLLGARYLEFSPGRSMTMLHNGATVHGGEFAKTYGVPDALDTFDARTRKQLTSMSGELGTALMGNGRLLNRGLRLAAPAQRPFQSIIQALRARPGSLERFAPSVASALAPLSDARNGIAEQFAPTAAALHPFESQRSAVRATLDVAPSSLAAATSGLDQGRALLDATRKLSKAINGTLPGAPVALRATQRLLEGAPSKLPAAKDLLAAVQPTVPRALQITQKLSPVLPKLDQALTYLVPLNVRVGRYHCDIANFGAVFRSMTGFTSPGVAADSNHPAGQGAAGQFRLQVTPSPDEALSLEDSGAADSTAPRDPYPEPCKYVTSRSTVEPLGRGVGR